MGALVNRSGMKAKCFEMNLFDRVDALIGGISMDQWREYCGQNPPTRATCKWCGVGILSTPWYAPSGTVHLTGWMHETTEHSSCGRDYPYRFAEPA